MRKQDFKYWDEQCFAGEGLSVSNSERQEWGGLVI